MSKKPLNRLRQKQMLESLANCYPNSSFTLLTNDNDASEIANLYYLREHQLVEASLDQTLSGEFVFSGARITAKGLDFLADDGGLSAILGTVTVKLHGDSIRELLLAKIDSSALPIKERNWLKMQVESMSGDALKAVTKSLVEQGLLRLPDLMQWARTMFESAA